MVVCKCRKATKLYCFVHKVPVCGECICFPEHHICVVRTYSEWVIDGEYDWPPRCCMCQLMLEDAIGPQTTRLGCLHVMHTNCLVSHIKCFPPQTAPAGYVCPTCSTPIWPPKSVKDSGSRLHSKLKEAIMQTDAKNNLLGNQSVSSLATDFHGLPPAFDSDPLVAGSRENKSSLYAKNKSAESANLSATEIRVIDEPNSGGSFMRTSSPPAPGAATRKGTIPFERQNSEISCNADDEDGGHKKYNRRGPIRHKLLRALLPFWSSALPTLPVTAPPRKDASTANEVREGRSRHQKSSRMDPRKILLLIAIVACMATMSILYYRIAQQDPGEELPDDERQ